MDGLLFVQLVEHIRSYGYEGRFYSKSIIYFDEDGFVYWTMGSPIAETTIVNRARKEDSYEYRLEHDVLPGKEADKDDDRCRNALEKAHQRMECPKGCDTSCPSCLMDYDQRFRSGRHDRHAAMRFMTREWLDQALSIQ